MIRRFLPAVLLLSLSLMFSPVGSAAPKVYIDIDSPTFQKFPIAVVDFVPLEGGGDPNLSSWFSEELGRYLQITGYFSLIDKKAFLEDQSSPGITADRIRFDDWTAIGAEYVIKGGFRESGDILTTECRLFDAVKGEMLIGKKYTGKKSDRVAMVQRFLDEVLLSLTGERSLLDTKIAFVMKKGDKAEIYSIGFDGEELTPLTDERSMILSPRWAPDGKSIAFTSYRDGNPDLYLMKLLSREIHKIAGFKGLNLLGSWSSDGSRMLFTLSYVGNEEIYMIETATGRLKRLTNNFDIDVSPAWSPDGSKIAFVSNRSGSPQIYLMDIDGGNTRRLTYEGNYNTSPAWFPRGKKIAFVGSVDRRFQIFTISEDGTNLSQLTTGMDDCESPTWSPDGRYLAFSMRRGDRISICVMNANGSNIRVLYEGHHNGVFPSWSPRLK